MSVYTIIRKDGKRDYVQAEHLAQAAIAAAQLGDYVAVREATSEEVAKLYKSHSFPTEGAED